MIKFISIFFCIFLFPVVSYAELTFEQLEEISTTPEHLEGEFIQEKYLSALDATLTSSGKFNYQRGESIRWETLEPIQNELIMTAEKIINKQGDQILMELDMDENPTVTIMGKIFFSVLTAEWGTLSDYFQLSGSLEDQKWNAELIPLDKNITQVISRVDLEGDTFLRKIIMYEGEGNQTTITFIDLDNNPK